MQDSEQVSVEAARQTDSAPEVGLERWDQFVRWAHELEAKVNAMEGALRELGDSLGHIREQAREVNDHYQEILDKHDQLVVYIQSSMQYCENKENIDALFEANETNSQTALELDEKLTALDQANRQAARELKEEMAALETRIAAAEDAAKGKMPMSQGEQLLKVLKIHHGKLDELYDLLNE